MGKEKTLKRAAVAGGTGLIGTALLHELLKNKSYDKIYVLSRRPVKYKDPRVQVVHVDFEKLDQYADIISANHYYCCLGGSSWKSKSQEGLERVDYTYCLAYAHLAEMDVRCTQLLIVTSIGASPTSSIPYNQIKGRLERSIRDLRLYGTQIFRPSLLIGERKETRFWEEFTKRLLRIASFFLVGQKSNFLSIRDIDVARAMYYVAQKELEGTHVYAPSTMRKITKKYFESAATTRT